MRAALLILLLSAAGMTKANAQTGALNGLFTINEDGDQVRFSQGNLQYQASTNTWQFAEHQYDYVGDANSNISQTYSGWIDLFGWGTSGYNHGAVCYQPWSTSENSADYYAYGQWTYNLYDQTGQADWGYNAIINGGNMENSGWRTLTRSEWNYVCYTRTTTSNIRYALAKVNDVFGIILLPDDWDISTYTLNYINGNNSGIDIISATDWVDVFEANGAVFLPSAGYRWGTQVYYPAEVGWYWSSSWHYDYTDFSGYVEAYLVSFGYLEQIQYIEPVTEGTNSRLVGGSVRLVLPAEGFSFNIDATPNPAEGGTVTGAGTYAEGATCTLTATANEDYVFVNWTENGEEVSTEATYSFTVEAPRNLTANFALPSFTITATANPSDGGTIVIGSSFDFENGTMQGWTSIDADGDGYGWEYNFANSIYGYNGSQGFVFSRSWIGNNILYPDNYLVSPQTSLGGSISFWACAQDANYAAEHFGVAVSTSGNTDPADFTTICEWTMGAKGKGNTTDATRSGNRAQGNWYQYTVDLSNYEGQSGYVAIRHFNCSDMFWIDIDDISFLNGQCAASYTSGEICTLTAVSNYGYGFVNWTEDGEEVSTDAEYSFTVTGDRELTANFVLTPFAITAVLNNDDWGAVSGSGEYFIGETCTLTATPAEGHSFLRWLENGQVVSTEAEYTFTIEGPRDLVAVFSPLEGSYIVFADPNVEAICVNNWDTDGDGFLSYEEAAAVTDIGQAFQNHSEITSFAELQYFTGLTTIAEYAFDGCSGLTGEFVIPDAITFIGGCAFRNCTGINTLTIGSGLELVNSQWDLVHYSESAFYNCTGITTLNYNAINCNNYALACYNDSWDCYNLLSVFSTCSSLATINIGENVQSIPTAAFKHTNVNTVNYNATNCNSMGGYWCTEQYAFEACEQLTTLTIGENVQSIPDRAFMDCSIVENLILPSSLTSIGNNAFSSCTGMTGELTIPASVTYIGGRAFENTGFTTVNFNATNCTYMGSYWDPVFADCNSLTTLTIGENVEVIPSYAFYNCSGFTGSINLPEVLTTIGEGAFQNCTGFTGSLVIPDNVTVISQFAFRECSGLDGTLTIGNSVTEIGGNAFYHCYGLTGELTIPNSVQTIGIGVFIDCAFTGTLTIGTGVTSMDRSAFRRCLGITEVHWNAINCTYAGDSWDYSIFNECSSLTTLVFADNVETIPDYTFCQCSALTGNLNLPNSLTSIGGCAFYGCSSLTGNLVIPDAVTYIGWEAFNGCSGLDGMLTIGNAVSEISEMAFYNTGLTILNYQAANCTYVGSYDYGNSSVFYNFTTVSFGDNVESLPSGAFRNCEYLTGTLTLPNSLTTIGEQAFYNCYGLEGIVMGNSVETIGNEAFRNCGGMRGELTLPETLLSVGTYAFAGCNEISVVNYNAVNCETMGNSSQNVFADCLSLTQIRIGANVESIPNYAFKPCFLVADMSVAATVPPTIGPSTFGTVSRSIPVHVPVGSGEAYRSAQYWEEFFNIVEDYSPSQYTCHWSANPNQFESNMTAIGVIQIEGVEQATDALELGAFCGDECRGSQLLAYYPEADRHLVFLTIYGAAGDPITFRLYDHEAEAESPLGCETHLAFEADGRLGTLAAPHPFNFTSIQVTTLPQGWTWWSGYVELEGNDGLGQMEESLGADGLTIKSRNDGFVSNYDGTWYGSLAAVNNESTYLIQTAAPCVMTVAGDMAEAASHPITLPEGWSWIGFPHSMAVGIGTALSGLEAENDDMLKSQESFSVYDADYGWVGTLHTLAPGMGLMYQSHGADAKTFTYALANRTEALEANRTARDNHWVPDHAAYSGNMSVIAVVELDGAELAEGDYEIAAFAGGECRGSVKLEQVEATGRHTAFLTVFGEEVESLSFALYDAETGMEVECSDDNAAFSLNAVVGSLREPVVIRFRSVTGIGEWAQAVNVYPNPVGRGQQVRLGLGAETTGKVQVEIVNAMGVVVESRRATSLQEVTAPSVAGIYTLRITAESGDVCYKKLVVR